MIGTVTDVKAYQWYVGGQWHVMSPSCSTISSPCQCATGSRDERVQIVWPISAVPILSFPERVSSRGWLSSERSRG
jgi:hypothetical protein